MKNRTWILMISMTMACLLWAAAQTEPPTPPAQTEPAPVPEVLPSPPPGAVIPGSAGPVLPGGPGTGSMPPDIQGAMPVGPEGMMGGGQPGAGGMPFPGHAGMGAPGRFGFPGFPDNPEDAELKDLVEIARLLRLARHLGLSEDQTIALTHRFQEAQTAMANTTEERNKALEQLKQLLSKGAEADAAEVEKTLDQIKTLDKQLLENRINTTEKLSEGMDAIQRAKLYVSLLDFRKDLEQMIDRAREKKEFYMRRNQFMQEDAMPDTQGQLPQAFERPSEQQKGIQSRMDRVNQDKGRGDARSMRRQPDVKDRPAPDGSQSVPEAPMRPAGQR